MQRTDRRQIARLTQALKSRGRSATRQRVQVLKYVLGTQDHFDAEGVLRAVKGRDVPVSRATVYRALAWLEECHLVRKVSTANGRWLFEKVPGKKRHQHICCAECGRIMEFSVPAIDRRIDEVSRAGGFAVGEHRFQVVGICNECRRRMEEGHVRARREPAL